MNDFFGIEMIISIFNAPPVLRAAKGQKRPRMRTPASRASCAQGALCCDYTACATGTTFAK